VKFRVLKLVLAACGLFPSLASAQTHKSSQRPLPPEAFKLVSIDATGSKRYKSEDIARATGLQLGQTAHEDDFQTAARHLGDTGAFTNVAYTFQYSPEGTKVEFQVQDSDKFVPVRFVNFVWFPERELKDKLHAIVPLFDGQLPATGELSGQVSEVLQAMLLEQKIVGTVDYTRVSPQDGPVEAIEYSVTGATRLVIRNVEFTGAGGDELQLLQSAAKNLQGAEYSSDKLHQIATSTFLPIYVSRGYLHAQIGDPEPKLAPKTNVDPADENDDETPVDVSFTVSPGHEYKVAGVEIEGNKAIPTSNIRPLIALKADQVANAVVLDDGIDAIKKLYGTHGHVQAAVRAEPEIDDSKSTVKYRIRVNEGDVFKMGDLEIQTPEAKTTAQLENNWTMRAGDVYDASYPKKFAAQVLKEVLTRGEWRTGIHETINEKEKTVDIVVRFDLK